MSGAVLRRLDWTEGGVTFATTYDEDTGSFTWGPFANALRLDEQQAIDLRDELTATQGQIGRMTVRLFSACVILDGDPPLLVIIDGVLPIPARS